MEVKINHEIRDYTESVFFGMSLRQCLFAAASCAVAVGLYFALKPYLGIEELSWVCILGAAPFAALGFIKWHGMTAEQFVWVWIKSELLTPKRLISRPENLYYDAHVQESKRSTSFLGTLGSALANSRTTNQIKQTLHTRANVLANVCLKASGKRDAHDKDAR